MDHIEDTSIFWLLHQIVHLSKYQAMKRMEAFELKPGQAGILFILNCNGGLSQRELAQKLGITPPSMTVALRKMEKLGYITKEPDPLDQRIIRIQIAEKGKECIQNLKGVMDNMENVLYQGMSQEERLLLRRLLLEIRTNLLEGNGFKGMDMETIMEKTRPRKDHCML